MTNQSKTRKRTAPAIWKQIFSQVTNSEDYEDGITLDMLEKTAKLVGHKITRESIRVKMHRYTSRKYIEKIGRGVYRIGPAGFKFFNIGPSAEISGPIKQFDKKPKATRWGHKKLLEIKKNFQSSE